MQQFLLGFLQQRTVGIILLEQLNARLCVGSRIVRVGNKSCKKRSKLVKLFMHIIPAPPPAFELYSSHLYAEVCWLRDSMKNSHIFRSEDCRS